MVDPPPRSVLLVRLRSIGDAVLMTVLAQAFRRAHPGATLGALLEPGPASLLEGHPAIDRVIPIARGLLPRLAVLARLRRERYDLALDLHGGPTAALLTRFCRARTRVGLEAYRHRHAYDRLLPSPLTPGSPLGLHTVESNLAIARALGLDPDPASEPTLQVTGAGRALAARALAAAGLEPEQPFVALHPGAALRSKTWPAERFAQVAAALAAEGTRVLLVTPPGGLDPALADLGLARVHTLAPLALPALLAVLARARLLVANDSGPAHMAAAVRTPTVAVFGSQDPRVWRPWGAHHRALWAALPCSPCRGFTCDNPHPFECLDAIAAERVLAEAREVLAGG